MKTLPIFLFLVSSIAFAGKSNTGTSGGGRFQIIQLSDMRRDQYLLDTQTGKIWSKTCAISGAVPPDCELEAWMQDNVVGVNISEADFYKRVRDLKKYMEEQKASNTTPASK